MKPKITVVLAGGTIDKEYDALDLPFTIGSGAVARVLKNVNPNFEVTLIPVMQKVSVKITDEDKERIRKTCAEAIDDKILVSYGTDAMTDIAQVLSPISGKTIVITGALKSQLIKDTDAEFNIGFAFAAVQTLAPGVYIAMSGRVYDWNACKKDVKTGQFVEL